jgi:S-adenosylmethionine decarboxylase
VLTGKDQKTPVGHHHILELECCSAERLADPEVVSAAMRRAIERAGLTLLDQTVHAFAPHGVTGVALLAESHLAVHTWPEHGYAAVDLFSCGDCARGEAACRELAEALGPARSTLRVIGRGPAPNAEWATASAAHAQSSEHSNSE